MQKSQIKTFLSNLNPGHEVACLTDPENPPRGNCEIRTVVRCNQKWLRIKFLDREQQFYYGGSARTGEGTLRPVSKKIRAEVIKRQHLADTRQIGTEALSPRKIAGSCLTTANGIAKALNLARAICPSCRAFAFVEPSQWGGASYSCGHFSRYSTAA